MGIPLKNDEIMTVASNFGPKSFASIHYTIINIWQMSWQSHTLHHDQTKHPTENFISQILSKIH